MAVIKMINLPLVKQQQQQQEEIGDRGEGRKEDWKQAGIKWVWQAGYRGIVDARYTR
jgi:hypothetical protein